MRLSRYGILLSTLCTLVSGCANSGSPDSTTATKEIKEKPTETHRFTLPEIPAMLTTTKSKQEYLALHYWQNFNFSDTLMCADEPFVEQCFANFLHTLSYVPLDIASQAIAKTIEAATVDSLSYARFTHLAEKYLYDPNSPMRQEDLYISALQVIVNSSLTHEAEHYRAITQLNRAMKNRVGNVAADFNYTLHDGKTEKMHDLKGEYTLLFFNNPDCHDCTRVKEFITADRKSVV